MRLHIGGKEPREGWKILNVNAGPGVDFVGDCVDLGRFESGSVQQIYASHVLEHLGYARELPDALKEWYRVLVPGGKAMISVPDFEVMCRLFIESARDEGERFHIMRMTFGGQAYERDFHRVGLTYEFLVLYLEGVGFARIERVDDLALFDDTSRLKYLDTPISVNVVAWKD